MTLDVVRSLINDLISKFYKVEFPVAVQDQSEDAPLCHEDASDIERSTLRHRLRRPSLADADKSGNKQFVITHACMEGSCGRIRVDSRKIH